MDGREYREAVRSLAWPYAKAAHTHVHIAWGIGPLLLGAGVGFVRERAMGVALSSSSGWLWLLLDGVVALVVWLVAVVAPFYYLKGARGLYLASQNELSVTKAALVRAKLDIEAAQHASAAKLETLQEEHSKDIDALQQELALRPKPEPPPPVAVEPLVSSVVLNVLRETYDPCRSAAGWAREYLIGFCLNWSGGPADRWEPIVSRLLIESRVLSDSLWSLQRLNERLAVKGDITASQFADLLQTFDGLLSQYARLCKDIISAGTLFAGGEAQLRSQSPYSQLYQEHLEAVGALRKVRPRDDFGELAKKHVKELQDLLPSPVAPPPPAGPPPTAASK